MSIGIALTGRARPTMRDVAALAGVSLKTVSRVVNAEPGVSEDLIARVQRAAAQLDYRHNLAASNLRRGVRTMSIGVVIQDVSNTFSATILRAIEDRARERGIAVYAASLDEEEQRERDVVRGLVERRVDGLVMMPASSDQSYLVNDVRAGLAMVFVDRAPTHLDADTVLVDNVRGGRIGTQQLIDHGHRRIGFVGDRVRIATAADRRSGYLLALEGAGIVPTPGLVRHGVRSGAEAELAVLDLLDQPDPPTAIFAARNVACVGTIRALHRLGKQHKVALVGFDDFPLSDLVQPATTVVSMDARALGHAAADLLFTRMDGGQGPTKRLTYQTTVIARGSGEIPPAD